MSLEGNFLKNLLLPEYLLSLNLPTFGTRCKIILHAHVLPNSRPRRPWHSACCCLSLSFNIVCRCRSTRPAASRPALGNPRSAHAFSSCPHRAAAWAWTLWKRTDTALLPVQPSDVGLVCFLGNKQPGGQFLESGKALRLIFCLQDALGEPQPCTIISVAVLLMARGQWALPAALKLASPFSLTCPQAGLS